MPDVTTAPMPTPSASSEPSTPGTSGSAPAGTSASAPGLAVAAAAGAAAAPEAGPAAVTARATALPVLEGRPTRAPRGAAATILAALSGWLLVRAVGTFVATLLLGLKREDRFQLEEKCIRREHKTELLGRVIREGKEYLPYGACLSVARETRFRASVLLVGLAALLAGTMVGVGLVFDGIRGAFLRLVLLGLGVLLAGVAIDLLLFVLADGAVGRVFVTFRLTGRRAFRIRGARRDVADRFIEEVARRVPARLDK